MAAARAYGDGDGIRHRRRGRSACEEAAGADTAYASMDASVLLAGYRGFGRVFAYVLGTVGSGPPVCVTIATS